MSIPNGVLKSLLCGVAAMMITTTMSWGMIQSTATYPWAASVETTRPATAKVLLTPLHTWLGQPSPAVLVD